MDQDDVDIARKLTLMSRTKVLAMKRGQVRTNYIGKWKSNGTGIVYFVYERHYTELGIYEYALKASRMGGVEDVIFSFRHLCENFTRTDKLKEHKDEDE